jgi:hypothetical protein
MGKKLNRGRVKKGKRKWKKRERVEKEKEKKGGKKIIKEKW